MVTASSALAERVPCLLAECGNLTRARRSAGYCSDMCRDIAKVQLAERTPAPDGCRPRSWDTLPTRWEVDEHRRLDCRRYSECLTYVSRQGWRGFSCISCPVRDEISVDEKFEQMTNLLRLHAAAEEAN